MLYTTNTEVFAVCDAEKSNLCMSREDIVMNPERDFTRNTKASIPMLMGFVVPCGSASLKLTIQDLFDEASPYHSDTGSAPYVSTFTEARSKVRAEAFECLYRNVTGRRMCLASWQNNDGLDFHLLPMAMYVSALLSTPLGCYSCA